MNRRHLLQFAGGALLNGVVTAGLGAAMLQPAAATATSSNPAPAPAPAPARDAKVLSFVNTHTGDRFSDAYWEGGAYVPDAMDAIKYVMRDHRSGELHDIDPGLLEQLHELKGLLGASAPYQIISGYRSPTTNAALRAQSNGVASRSLHMDGRAIDVRISGIELSRLRDAALGMRAGGVGYYEGPNFVHLDTGRVRRW